MAGAASFGRGERYAISRRVKKLKVTEGELSATVAGTRNYQVRIWAEEGGLSYPRTTERHLAIVSGALNQLR
jgi:uncharacterized Zn finger protein